MSSANDPTSEPANDPTSEPANDPTSEPANTLTSEPANTPISAQKQLSLPPVIKDSYRTIHKPGKGEFKSKGSKFFAYASHVNTIEEVKDALDKLKAEHFKSRHVCYAYRLDHQGDQYRANDDGEPSGTAGLPILNVLKSHELVKALIAVVRYFGGTKLGVSGLIEAYKLSADDAIQQTDIQEDYIYDVIKLEFPYDELGNLMNCVAKSSFKIIEQSYDEVPFLKLAIRKSLSEKNMLSIYSQLLGYDITDMALTKEHVVKHVYLDEYEGRL